MGGAHTPDGLREPRVTAGTCPHYAMFDAEVVVRGDTRLKVAPPLRDGKNRRRLWSALLSGEIAMLYSDHTPSTLEERAGSFFEAFTGISGLQFTLPATWTEGREHGATLRNLTRWLSEEPAKLAGVIHPYPTLSEAVRRAAAGYLRGRLTPRTKRILGWWFRHRR